MADKNLGAFHEYYTHKWAFAVPMPSINGGIGCQIIKQIFCDKSVINGQKSLYRIVRAMISIM